MAHNFEQVPNNKKVSDKNEKEMLLEEKLLETKKLADLSPGTVFTLQQNNEIKRGKVIGKIGDKENSIYITWIDTDKVPGTERLSSETIVQTEKLSEKKPELKQILLGDAKPNQQLYLQNPETKELVEVRIIMKISPEKGIQTLINGQKTLLPWDTPVIYKAEQENRD